MRNLKRALSLLLSSTMVLGMVVMGGSAAGYQDVDDTYNKEAIEVLQAVGIMSGVDNAGNFNPEGTVTRNEMAVIMSNLMEYNVATYKDTSPFTDVPDWAEPYVAACYTNGITAGISETTYGGDQTVTTAQAALMLMKALGYFQYTQDFGSDWQLAAVKQANAIDLFNGVNSGVTEPMTRNDVAQLVLNTLESGIVQAETSGSITVGGVTISTDVKYNYVTSNAGYAKSISDEKSTTNTTDATASIVELGEDLYQGDLARDWDANDAFGRPADIWSYKDNEIGTYVNDRTATWTTKVSERDLYRSAGTTAVDNYAWNIYVDGELVDSTNRPNGYDLDRNDTDRWMKTGNGVLTEMFVDTVSETVNVTMINSYVAEVTRVEADADEGDYNVTVNYKTQPAGVAMDRQFNSETEFAQGDIVIVNAAKGNIEAMTLAQTVEGTVDAVKNNDYLKIGGNTYNYNYAYTIGTVLSNYSDTNKGLYDLKNSTPANPSAGDDVIVYLDANGCAVAIADAGLIAEDYIYVKGVHYMYGDYSARVVHYDGTEEDVTIDEIDDSSSYTGSTQDGDDKIFIDYTNTDKMGLGVYKYDGGSKYDLYTSYNSISGEQFSTAQMSNVKIENGRARIGEYNDSTNSYIQGTNTNWAVDNNTVYVDVANNTSYTGYQNVPTMSNVEGWVVMDGTNDTVADVVFITNDDVRYEEDNDSYFVVTSSTPEESLLESDSKTRAANDGVVWTYNVWVNGEATTLKASEELTNLDIGVWKITGRDSNGLVKDVEQIVSEASMIPFATNFDTYATYRTADSLTLHNPNASDVSTTTNKHDHFAITADSLIVVAQMNKDNDSIEDIVPGSLNDIQVVNSANPKDSATSAVFVLNSKDDDFGTVAKLVLVVNPDPAGNTTGDGGSSTNSGIIEGEVANVDSIDASVTISKTGTASVTYTMDVPEYIPDGAKVTAVKGDVNIDGVYDSAFNATSGTTTVSNGKITFRSTLTGNYDTAWNVTLSNVTVDYDMVSVKYVNGDTGATIAYDDAIFDTTTPLTKTMNTSGTPSIDFQIKTNTTSTPALKWSVSGLATASDNKTAQAFGTDNKTAQSITSTSGAAQTGYVTVTITGLSQLSANETYDVNIQTGLASGSTANIGTLLTGCPADASNLKVAVTASRSTGLKPGDTVVLSYTPDSTKVADTAASGYKVILDVEGQTVELLYPNDNSAPTFSDTTSVVVKNEDIDVTIKGVEAVAAPKIVSITASDVDGDGEFSTNDTITIVFDKELDSTVPTLTKVGTLDMDTGAFAKDAEGNDIKTTVVYKVTTGVSAADSLTIAAKNIKGADGVINIDGFTITTPATIGNATTLEWSKT